MVRMRRKVVGGMLYVFLPLGFGAFNFFSSFRDFDFRRRFSSTKHIWFMTVRTKNRCSVFRVLKYSVSSQPSSSIKGTWLPSIMTHRSQLRSRSHAQCKNLISISNPEFYFGWRRCNNVDLINHRITFGLRRSRLYLSPSPSSSLPPFFHIFFIMLRWKLIVAVIADSSVWIGWYT